MAGARGPQGSRRPGRDRARGRPRRHRGRGLLSSEPPQVQLVRAPNPGPFTLDGTNTWIVGTSVGSWVIDPGPRMAEHAEAVRTEAASLGDLLGVILTHGHADHAESAGDFGVTVHRPGDGEDVGPFHAVATPGHSADHVCLMMGRACFCGDLILGAGSTIVPPDGGSLVAYMRSLERLRELDPDILYPGHGPVIEEPKAKIAEYIEHRLSRERSLVTAMDAGERSRARLLSIAWHDVAEPMLPAAAEVMRAHLEKLRAEGRLPEDLVD